MISRTFLAYQLPIPLSIDAPVIFIYCKIYQQNNNDNQKIDTILHTDSILSRCTEKGGRQNPVGRRNQQHKKCQLPACKKRMAERYPDRKLDFWIGNKIRVMRFRHGIPIMMAASRFLPTAAASH